MNKIKICHFTNIITGKSDGVYTHLKMIFKFVDSDKFKQYFVFQGNPDIETEIAGLGVKVHVIKSLNKKISLKCFREFYSFIKSENIDIIHAHFLKPYSIAGLSNIFLRKKMIFNYHGLFINNPYNNMIDKFFYKRIHELITRLNLIDYVIVPSVTSRQILLNETNQFKTVKTYYNGFGEVTDEQVHPEVLKIITKLKRSFFLIGIIARIDIQKRIDIALEIAKEITKTKNDIFFVIFGDGALEKEMAKKIMVMELNQNVKMLGYIPTAKLYIKYFDLLLFTSDWEGFPLSVWEAMAAKVPVVSTDVGGIKEILEKEKCGLTYPKGDVQQGVKTILELLSDEKKRKVMGQSGYNAIKAKYNAKIFSDFFNDLYLSLFHGNSINS